MAGRILALTVAGALTLGVSLASQQTKPTFRSSADLVRLHVVVRDADGRPVPGLTKDDFALLDTKQPRAIELFEEVSRPATLRVPAIVPAAFPLDVADNRTARASNLVVILFDDMVIRPYLEKSKALAKDAVSKLAADALLAFLTTSGTDGVEATADHSAILRAIDRIGTRSSKAPKIPQRFGDQTSHATLAESQSINTTVKSCHLETLTQAARMVAGPESTRRIFLYISPFCGMDKFLPAAADDPHQIAVENLMEALRQADVVLYAMDPRGQMGFKLDQFPALDVTGADPLPWEYAGRVKTLRSSSPVLNSQEGLRELTRATGGFAVTNSTAYDKGLDQIADDLSHYYVLGFYADDPKPNRFHPVEVQVKRPGLTGRFRPGYFSGKPVVREDKDPMVRLAAGAIPTPDLPMRLFAASQPSAKGTRVSLVVDVGWTGLEKPDAAGTWSESLDAVVMVAKVLSGRIERKWAVKRPVAVPVTTGSHAGPGAYQVLTQVELPPGTFQIRVSAKSLTTGRTGSVYLAAEVPKTTPLGMSDIFVGSPNRAVPVLAPSPTEVTPLPFAITLDRVFRQNERIRLLARLSPTRLGQPMKATLQFMDAAGSAVHSIDVPVTTDGHVIDATVDLRVLTQGAYRAVLTVTGAGTTESREVSLVVK